MKALIRRLQPPADCVSTAASDKPRIFLDRRQDPLLVRSVPRFTQAVRHAQGMPPRRDRARTLHKTDAPRLVTGEMREKLRAAAPRSLALIDAALASGETGPVRVELHSM